MIALIVFTVVAAIVMELRTLVICTSPGGKSLVGVSLFCEFSVEKDDPYLPRGKRTGVSKQNLR